MKMRRMVRTMIFSIVMMTMLAPLNIANAAEAKDSAAVRSDEHNSVVETEPVEIEYTLEGVPMVDVIEEIPRYYQNYYFYSFLPYGNGTLGSSGCGITSLAMVATYVLDDYTLTPDALAEEFGSYRGTNIDRMEHAANELGIPFEKTFKWKSIVSALEDGKMAIILVNSNTKFTEGGHLMLLTGITEDGLIYLHDPNYRNYEAYESQFETGFPQWEFIKGFQGGWIFEK